MSNLTNLTNEEIQEKILEIFNKNPWVLKPNPNNLNSNQEIIYSEYQELKEHLEDRRKHETYPVDYHNNVPYKNRIFS